jgi:hypothetical protein
MERKFVQCFNHIIFKKYVPLFIVQPQQAIAFVMFIENNVYSKNEDFQLQNDSI